MNTEKKANKILMLGGAVLIAAATILGVWGVASAQPVVEETKIGDYVYPKSSDGTYDFPTFTWQTEGYDNLASWWEDLQAKRAEYTGKADEAIAAYGSYLSEEQQNQLRDLESKLVNAVSFTDITEYENQFNEVVNAGETAKADAEALAAQQAAVSTSSSGGQYYSNGSGLTQQSGVNYYDGRRETYYSSNVLYHYRTPEWTVDSEGFYRDSAGRYVVAASDMPQGSVFQGSKGECIVADSGCAANTTDYYVNW